MSDTEPVWLEMAAVIQLHGEQLAEFGGIAGLRDAGLLASALDRPKNVWAYTSPKPDVSLIACHMFLIANELMLEAPQQEQAGAILDLAAGTIDETQFADWLRPRVRQLP